MSVIYIDHDSEVALEGCVNRTMQLQAMIQDGQIWFGTTDNNIEIGLDRWYPAGK